MSGTGTVRAALKEHASALEEGKADILGVYMIQKLRENGEITEGELAKYLRTDRVSITAGAPRGGGGTVRGRLAGRRRAYCLRDSPPAGTLIGPT